MINRSIVKFYKTLLPGLVRNKITIFRNSGGLNTIRKNILAYYQSYPEKINDEVQLVLNFLRKNPLCLFPYNFTRKYQTLNIGVYKDHERSLHYVLYNGKRMYFKKSWPAAVIKDAFVNLLMEQDTESPHRYLAGNFNVNFNDVVADVGAAEGIFALSVIEKAKKVYIFETDKEWIEALDATFNPWADKVEIINKFVSNKNDANNITLDQFIKEKNILFDFLKVDVDGAEILLIEGSHELLNKSKNIKVAVCTYHKGGDESLFREIFETKNMTVSATPGYMIFYYDPGLTFPYLRRGLLQAYK